MIKNILASGITTVLIIIGFMIGVDTFIKPKDPNSEDVKQISLEKKIIEKGVGETGERGTSIVSVSSVVGIASKKNAGNRLAQVLDNTWSVGSGCILDSKGYIVTNYHVIGSSKDEIYVTLYGGDVVKGKVLWSNSDLDLAVIKIAVAGLPAADMGDSDSLKIGERAIAIGNPLGFDFQGTLTSGVISGLNRSVEVNGVYMEDLIQTDASINNGNSGGPLMNEEGKVIGINTIKVESAEGIGFAIPINIIKPIINKFVNKGEFVEPYLGLSGYDRAMTSNFISNIILKTGIYVANVDRKSPAEEGGIKSGDILLSADDTDLDSLCKLKMILFSKNIGETVKFRVLREDVEFEVNIKVASRFV